MADDNEVLLRMGLDVEELQRQLDAFVGTFASNLQRSISQVTTGFTNATTGGRGGNSAASQLALQSKEVKNLVNELISLRTRNKQTFDDFVTHLRSTAGESAKAKRAVETFANSFDTFTKKSVVLEELERTIATIGNNKLVPQELIKRLQQTGVGLKQIVDVLTEARLAEDKIINSAVRVEQQIGGILTTQRQTQEEKTNALLERARLRHVKRMAALENAEEEKKKAEAQRLEKERDDLIEKIRLRHVKRMAKLENAEEEKALKDKEKLVQQSAQRVNKFFQGLAFNVGILGFGLSILGGHLTRIGTSLIQFGQRVTASTEDIDLLRQSLVGVTGDVVEAEKQFAELRTLSLKPGLSFEGAVRGAVQLQQQKFSFQEAKRIVTEYGNAIALAGGKQEDLNEVIEQTRQILQSPTLELQDVKSLVKRFAGSNEALIRAFGTADVGQLREQIEGGKLSKKDFITQFAEGLAANRRAPDSFANSMKNLRESGLRLGATLGTVVAPAFNKMSDIVVNKLEPAITRLADKFKTLSEQSKLAISAIVFGAPIALVAIGGLLSTLGALGVVISAIRQGVTLLRGISTVFGAGASAATGAAGAGTAIEGLSIGFTRLLGVVTKLAGPIGIIITAVTVLVDNLPEIVSSVNDLVSASTKFYDVLSKSTVVLKTIQLSFTPLLTTLGLIGDVLGLISAVVGSIITGSIDTITAFVTFVTDILEGKGIIQAFVNLGKNLQTILDGIGARLTRAVTAIVARLLGIIDAVFGTNLAERLTNFVNDLTSSVGDKLAPSLKKAQEELARLNEQLSKSAPEEYKQRIEDLAASMKLLSQEIAKGRSEFLLTIRSGELDKAVDDIDNKLDAVQRRLETATTPEAVQSARASATAYLNAFSSALADPTKGDVAVKARAKAFEKLAQDINNDLLNKNSPLAKAIKTGGQSISQQIMQSLALDARSAEELFTTLMTSGSNLPIDMLLRQKGLAAFQQAAEETKKTFETFRERALKLQQDADDKLMKLEERNQDAIIKQREIATEETLKQKQDELEKLKRLNEQGLRDTEIYLVRKAELDKQIIDTQLQKDIAEQERKKKQTDLASETEAINKQIAALRSQAEREKAAIDAQLGVDTTAARQRVRVLAQAIRELQTEIQDLGLEIVVPELLRFAVALREVGGAVDQLDKRTGERIKQLVTDAGFSKANIGFVANFVQALLNTKDGTEFDKAIKEFVDNLVNESVREINDSIKSKENELQGIFDKLGVKTLEDAMKVASRETRLEIQRVLLELEKLGIEVNQRRKRTTEELNLIILQEKEVLALRDRERLLAQTRLQILQMEADGTAEIQRNKYNRLKAEEIIQQAELTDIQDLWATRRLLMLKENHGKELQIIEEFGRRRTQRFFEARRDARGQLPPGTNVRNPNAARVDSSDPNAAALNDTAIAAEQATRKIANVFTQLMEHLNNSRQGIANILTGIGEDFQRLTDRLLEKIQAMMQAGSEINQVVGTIAAIGVNTLGAAIGTTFEVLGQALAQFVETGKISLNEIRKLIGQSLVAQGFALIAQAAAALAKAFVDGLLVGGLVGAFASAAAAAPGAAAAAAQGAALVAAGAALGAGTGGAATTAASNAASVGTGAVGSNTTTGEYDPDKDPRILYQKGIAAQISIDIRQDDASIVKTIINNLNNNTKLAKLIGNNRTTYTFTG